MIDITWCTHQASVRPAVVLETTLPKPSMTVFVVTLGLSPPLVVTSLTRPLG